MWYETLYRRHLLDMHIEDWHPDFLSRFSPETYVENLKRARINYAMIYFQSHVGLCYYPTDTGTIHRAFVKQPDQMRRLVDLAHEAGIRVCGYYSLIHNTREHDAHPEWRMLEAGGQSRRERLLALGQERTEEQGRRSRYGFCCPNHPEYRAFVGGQIDEMLAYFDFDAFFFDMPFWPHTCYCEHCRALYRNRYGHDMPQEPAPHTAEYTELTQFKYEMMADFVRFVTRWVKSRRPDMPVEHNFANSIAANASQACGEGVAAQCDYVGGDLYGNLYNHSFACKYFMAASRHQPFEQMFSRCKPALASHTLTKTPDEMKTAMALTMAHHGATLVIDAIDPVGTMDSRVYDQVGDIFAFQQRYEPYFRGTMRQDMGVYYGVRSNIDGDLYGSRVCCRNIGQTLIRAHVPFGVVGSFTPLDGVKLIAAPMLSELECADNERLCRWVEEGGVLYLSGMGNAALVERLAGHKLQGMTDEKQVYIAPTQKGENLFSPFNSQYPLPFEGALPIVEAGADCMVLATVTLPWTKPAGAQFASIHSNPPGIATQFPAVTVSRYGKGQVIWSAAPIEAAEYDEYRQIWLKLLDDTGALERTLLSDAPENVELTVFEEEYGCTLHAAVLCEESRSTPAPSFEVRLRVDAPVSGVCRMPEKTPVAFECREGWVVFRTEALHIFDMYQVSR